MINSAEQYEYVTGEYVDETHPHGDLDRIIIDGEIMLLRTGNTGKVDRDGNSISRAQILRGEDIAFLMEAVMQRYFGEGYCNAITGMWRWYWTENQGFHDRTWERTKDFTVNRMSFSRKLRHTAFQNMVQGDSIAARWFGGIYCGVDAASDYALNGISGFSAKVASSFDSDFFTDYGFSGLPPEFRYYRAFQPPSYNGALASKDLILSLFQTIQFMPCAYLGRYRPANMDILDALSLGTSAHNEHPDIQICKVEGEDPALMYSGHLVWGVTVERFRTFENEKEKWHNTTVYGTPQPGVYFFNVEAPHLAEATAILEMSVSWDKSLSESGRKKIWFPVPLHREGKKLFLYASGNLDSYDSLKSILTIAGWKHPQIPSDDNEFHHRAEVYIEWVHLLGKWDEHTKII